MGHCADVRIVWPD